MRTNNPRRVRLTRRGRIVAVVASGMVVAGIIAALVPLMLPDGDAERRPASLTIPEGWRSGQVYEAVDQALDAPKGSARKAIATAGLNLPAAAGGNPEGYLFPATYPVAENTSARSLLSQMVNVATKKFSGGTVAAGAADNAMNVYQAVTVASIVQAEAATEADMAKVARVIYNRLDKGMPLQMDSTLNYGLDRITVHTSQKDTTLNNPYNTYNRMGLPPTPIGNPGDQALRAASDPAPGDWLYFVTVSPGDTRFTASYEQQERNVAEFNRRNKKGAEAAG